MIDPVTDSTVQGLSNWLNDLWLVLWQKKKLSLNWPINVSNDQQNWLYCPETDQLAKWFMVGWLVD